MGYRAAVPIVPFQEVVHDLRELHKSGSFWGIYSVGIAESLYVTRLIAGDLDARSRISFDSGSQLHVSFGSEAFSGLECYLTQGELKSHFSFYSLNKSVPMYGGAASELHVYDGGSTVIVGQFIGQHLYGVEFQLRDIVLRSYEADDMFGSLDVELGDEKKG